MLNNNFSTLKKNKKLLLVFLILLIVSSIIVKRDYNTHINKQNILENTTDKDYDTVAKSRIYDKVINYRPENKVTIYEYYDISCFHCRKLHKKIFASSSYSISNFNFILRPVYLDQSFKEAKEKMIFDLCIYKNLEKKDYLFYLKNISNYEVEKISYVNLKSEVYKNEKIILQNKTNVEKCQKEEESSSLLETAKAEAYLLGITQTPSLLVVEGSKLYKFIGIGSSQAEAVIKDLSSENKKGK